MPAMIFTASPAKIMPATPGTQLTLPGAGRPAVPLCFSARTGRQRGRGAAHHAQALHAAPPQFPAQHPGQRVVLRFIKVRHNKFCRIQTVAAPHGADDGHAGLCGAGDQLDLRADGVDGVHDAVVFERLYFGASSTV